MLNKTIQIGTANGQAVTVGLGRLTRHACVAGTTGSGKTKTMQTIIEQLSTAGVSVFAPDMKGDLSGLAARDGEAVFPVKFWSLTGVHGTQIRTSVAGFGPVLLAKVLGFNDTQAGVLALAFAHASEHNLKLDTLTDLSTAIKKLAAQDEFVSKATVGVLLREITLLGQAGGSQLFGASNFKVTDLIDGHGTINLLSLQDVQDKPQVFSTFLLWLLTQLHRELPEIGDVPQPKLVFFFDEAHLLFADAPKLLVEQLERTVRLIRSKGVGVVFVTQAATDLPSTILGQLGNRIQHALRAFTPDDERVVKATARTFPKTSAFDVQETITSLAIGHAIVSVLGDTGIPSEPQIVKVRTPQSRMGALQAHEYTDTAPKAPTAAKVAAPKKASASPMVEAVVEEADILEEREMVTYGGLVAQVAQGLRVGIGLVLIFVVSLIGHVFLGRSVIVHKV